MGSRVNRRTFLKTTAAASIATSIHLVPSSAFGANDKVNLATIGCTHQGGGIGKAAANNKNTVLVACCDVMMSRAGSLAKLGKGPKLYDDFRKMFDEMEKDIDACTIGVPDHAHFPIAMRAMSHGIHIYVEKPLAHTFEECELMMRAEKKYKVAAQMGNQGHSGAQRLQFRQWVKDGIIKNVRKVDACMNKGRRWHPWGDVKSFPKADPMPEGMNWEVWTGTAPMHNYSKRFDHGNWRGWYDYGNGAFGDWGPHTLDCVHRFLNLGLPHEIRADKLEGQNDFIYPKATTIAFEFAERGEGMPAMTIYWYDGTKNKPKPPEGCGNVKMPACGKIIYSDDLIIKGGTHSSTHQIIGGPKKAEMTPDKLKLRDKGTTSQSHMTNFINAAMGKEECNSKFEVSAPLSQMFCLGCIAQRLGGKLEFDPKTKQITNNKRANELIKGHPPRKGWEEYYKLA